VILLGTHNANVFFKKQGAGRHPCFAYLERASIMAKKCQVSGVKPKKAKKISFSHKKHLRRQEPNLHSKRFWCEERNAFVKLKVSARVIKLITRVGLHTALKQHGTTLEAALKA
jgi:large subunit ribosomal protein L28